MELMQKTANIDHLQEWIEENQMRDPIWNMARMAPIKWRWKCELGMATSLAENGDLLLLTYFGSG